MNVKLLKRVVPFLEDAWEFINALQENKRLKKENTHLRRRVRKLETFYDEQLKTAGNIG